MGTKHVSSKKHACSAWMTVFSLSPGTTNEMFTLDAPCDSISTCTLSTGLSGRCPAEWVMVRASHGGLPRGGVLSLVLDIHNASPRTSGLFRCPPHHLRCTTARHLPCTTPPGLVACYSRTCTSRASSTPKTTAMTLEERLTLAMSVTIERPLESERSAT